MQKNNKRTNIIVTVITFALIVSFAGYFMITNSKKEENDNIVAVASMKEDAYNEYIESIKDILESKKSTDQVKVAKLSDEALYEVFANEKIYKETNKGNEYLDKLNEEATKNLNNSLNFLLSNGISKQNYEEIRIFADNPIHVSKKNIALFEREKEKVDKFLAQERQEKREELGAVQTGYSESEVKLILGSPMSITKSNEAEFWTYDGVILTMKNGYVFDITYSLE